jgi:hypothetical protein
MLHIIFLHKYTGPIKHGDSFDLLAFTEDKVCVRGGELFLQANIMFV